MAANGHLVIHQTESFGERLADRVVSVMGSWKFIIAQTVFVICWVSLNLIALFRHFDPFPFILLNLCFSTQAAYSSPLILMAQNRTYMKDKKRDDVEAREVEDLIAIQYDQIKALSYIRELQDTQMKILRIMEKHMSIEEEEELRNIESATSLENQGS